MEASVSPGVNPVEVSVAMDLDADIFMIGMIGAAPVIGVALAIGAVFLKIFLFPYSQLLF